MPFLITAVVAKVCVYIVDTWLGPIALAFLLMCLMEAVAVASMLVFGVR